MHKLQNRSCVIGLVASVSNTVKCDEQMRAGKSLSDHEEEVLQALEIVSRNQREWLKASDLREQAQRILGYSNEQIGHAKWMGHILNRVQLVDGNRRTAYSGRPMYSVKREDALVMMRRYEVSLLEG